MNLFKKIFVICILTIFSINILACGTKEVVNETSGTMETTTEAETESETEPSKKKYKIGALQLVQHSALDASYQGFVDYLTESGVDFEIDYQNASGEQSACETIAEKFANDKLDLCYAIATPAAQSVIAHVENVPIVASAVTDPAGSGLCDSNEVPGGNLTAASDLTPVEAQFDLLVELLPDAKNVGVLYCSAESNSKIQADMAISAANKRGLNPTEYTAVNSTDIQTVMESMIGKVDVIYIPTDNVMAAGMSTIATIVNENKIPTIVGEEGMCDAGGYATYGINYYELGKLAGRQAYEILVEGKNPGEMPVEYLNAESCERKINKETAEVLGLKAE